MKNPEIILVTGGVCTGKSTYINKNIPDDYVSIDAGDIFIELSEGEYYDFPAHLEDEMNRIGQEKLKEALTGRKNIVLELIGNDTTLMAELIGLLKKTGYKVKLAQLTCDVDVAIERNNNRPEDNISAYFTEPYHFEWFKKVITELSE
jgi:dephospho-CoA kinase